MAKKPPLTLVGSTVTPPGSAPAGLGPAGAASWRRIQDEFAITDSGGLELLEQICFALDEIAECGEIIAHEGRVLRGKFGSREHPLMRHQLASRSFVVRAVKALGISLEPIKAPGRPGNCA